MRIPKKQFRSLSLLLVACGQEADESESNPMEYIAIEDLPASINEESEEYKDLIDVIE